ncbi:nuclear transport factor 2 family protein [Pinibacter aurantiacus]|uniref:Nuclear transport factor 2 family protein n=1 Tax=Pinibacter aurantiacus TaxID=2851599 RepID=A0A9E2W900_9BACT|nr:nuclear transport factor 2 family protein [Pinibacter aurantiacus]MBV4358952.1 nuclear transport factor 2 family protein [Pinibacter aurantiacus]
MKDVSVFIQNLYQLFNDRKIEEIVAHMDEDVKWANAMDGNFVYGPEAVREYWTKQFEVISSKVKPLTIEVENGVVKVHVHQVVHDVNGALLADQVRDHYFRLKNDKIIEFGIRENEIDDAGWTF